MKHLKRYALFEGAKSTLVVVDVQPSYDRFFDVKDYIKLLDESVGRYSSIVYLFNGEELGMESESEIYEWLYTNGLSEEKLGRIQFYEKNYGWFRELMDDVDEDELLTVIEHMRDHNLTDASDIDDWSEIDTPEVERMISDGYNLSVPDELFDYLDRFNDIDLVGGKDTECLREVEIILTAMGKRFDTLERYVY
jgi:hypothetical protein